MASEYKLNPFGVIRTSDGACIPPDPANKDWAEYQKWLAAGGVPDPYVPPEPPPTAPTGEQTVLYDHENRLRVIEGEPPLTLDDFLTQMRQPPQPPKPQSQKKRRRS